MMFAWTAYGKALKFFAACLPLVSWAAGGVLDPVELPYGYEQLEYVESTGGQYVDTRLKPGSTTTVSMGFSYRGGVGSSSFLMGSRKAFKDCAFYLSHQKVGEEMGEGFAFSRGDKMAYSSLHGEVFHTATLTAEKKFCLDGNEIGDLSTEATVYSDNNIYLFALNNAGSAKDPSVMRLYSCDIAENGTLVRSFVPVRRFGIVGLFDTVEQRFYPPAYVNNSNTPLVAGPELAVKPYRPVPAGYTHVEYVRSSNHAMLNTEFIPDSTTEMHVRLKPTDSGDVHMVGSRTAYQNKGFGLSNNSGLTMACGSSVAGSGVTCLNEMIDVAFFEFRFYVKGVFYQWVNGGTFTGDYPMYVFTINNGGTPHAQYANIELAELQILTNGVPAREFVAAKDAQGTPGLYDFVTERFFTCSQGTLTAGPEVIVETEERLVPSQEQYEDGVLSMQVTRQNGQLLAESVTLAYGRVVGGDTAADWEGSCTAGAFAAGETQIALAVANTVPDSARYARLFTPDGSSKAFDLYTLVGRYVRPALPAGYRAAEYLASGATQFGYIIDTGYVHREGTRIECVADITKSFGSGSGWCAVFGTRYGSSWTAGGGYAFFAVDNSAFVPRYNRSSDKVVGAADSLPYGEKVKVVTENDTMTWYSEPAGVKLGELVTPKGVDAGVNTMAIFDLNDSPKAGGFNVSGSTTLMKLYSFMMIDDGRVSRDFVPCLNEYGEPGLYETILGTFHGNRGIRSVDFKTDLPTTEATYTWTGAGTTADWSDAANWSCSSAEAADVPGWSSAVVFPSGTSVVNVDRPVAVRTLDLSAADVALRLTAAATNTALRVRYDLTFGATSDPATQGLWISVGGVQVGGKLVAGSGAGAWPLHFAVPQGGFAAAPLSFAGTSFTGGVCGRVYVDAQSPAYKGGKTTVSPLIAAGTDMTVDNVTLEALPQRHPTKESAYVWRGVRALGVTLESAPMGLVISVQ